MAKGFRINILSPQNKIVKAAEGRNLADVLISAGIPLNHYCGGSGLCGKCVVKIVRGEESVRGDEEKKLLKEKKISKRFRLACLHSVCGHLTIKVPEVGLLGKRPVLDSGTKSYFFAEPRVKKYSLEIMNSSLSSPDSLIDALESRFHRRLRLSLKSAQALPRHSGRRKGRRITMTVLDDKEVLDIESGDTSKRIFGMAVDIGTSTVVLELVDLTSGMSLGRSSAVNAQVRYGVDVVSRIAMACREADSFGRLTWIIRKQINGLIDGLARKHRVSPVHIYDLVIAGNTAMNHLFLGVPVSTLALAPFQGVFGKAPEARACELGLKANPEARIYTAPNIKSFIGGDITAGLAALDIAGKPGNFLFIDLGTNGEIVLKTERRRMTAASTAAGPAFEGMSISCGMPAVEGAIHKAHWRNGFAVTTIGDGPARGVCGTGLIDILALSLKKGLIADDGRIIASSKLIRITRRLVLTQQDIRRMQLAIAAVKSGIRMILKKEGLPASNLDKIFVAGAFGSSLNVANAMAVGLLPSLTRDKVLFVGNSSLAGARKLLLSSPERNRIESLARTIRHMSLAADRTFQDQFLRALRFQSYSGDTA